MIKINFLIIMDNLKIDENDIGADPMQNLPKTKFGAQILKSVIGEQRA